MSTIESVRGRYRTLGDQRYAPLVKGIGLFSLFAALPAIIEIDVAGMGLAALLSLKVFILTVIYICTAQMRNIMPGYTGRFSFGHMALFGVGTYAMQALVVNFAVNPWVGMFVGGVITAGCGLIIDALSFCFNLQGHYFVLATLAFVELLRFVVISMSGLRGIDGYFKPFPRDYGVEYDLVAFQFQSDLPYYYLIVDFPLVVTFISQVIKNSWVGLYFFAIHKNERAVANIDVSSFRYKLVGVVVSAFSAALDGVYWSMYFNTTRPDIVFAPSRNVELLPPAVAGGPGTLLGLVIGSLTVTPVNEIAWMTLSGINDLGRIIYGAFLVAIVIYLPRGAVSWPSQMRVLWTHVRGNEEVNE